MATIRHTSSFDLPRAAKELFPLFSPEGEKLWVPGWDYENILGTTELAEDYVFLTSNHDQSATDAIWLVKRYDPARFHIELYRVEPGEKVGIVTVRCTAKEPALTRVEVTYEYIGLSPSGDAFIESFSADAYDRFIGQWQTLLLEYLESQG